MEDEILFSIDPDVSEEEKKKQKRKRRREESGYFAWDEGSVVL